jgi:hypothetical protein
MKQFIIRVSNDGNMGLKHVLNKYRNVLSVMKLVEDVILKRVKLNYSSRILKYTCDLY